jgi:hypothetical protein
MVLILSIVGVCVVGGLLYGLHGSPTTDRRNPMPGTALTSTTAPYGATTVIPASASFPSRPFLIKLPVEYENSDYGFVISLPTDWRGYQIVQEQWEGDTSGNQGNQFVTDGPLISIESPSSTAANPYQDIPIMIFTLDQWTSYMEHEFWVSAAGVPAIELARNNRYVFALPPRYIDYDLPGAQEVVGIMQSDSFQSITLK